MSTIYLESSAVLAWLFEDEAAHATVYQKIKDSTVVATSVLTLMETKRVLARMTALGEISAADQGRLLGVFKRESSHWEIFAISEAIEGRLGQIFPQEPVRTLDAIHLATALEAIQILPELKVLSVDKRIQENLPGLGLELA